MFTVDVKQEYKNNNNNWDSTVLSFSFCMFVLSSLYQSTCDYSTFEAPVTENPEFINSVDPDEAALSEPLHQDLHCLSSTLEFQIRYS